MEVNDKLNNAPVETASIRWKTPLSTMFASDIIFQTDIL